jgi:DNA-binding response OmpR family regulator
VPKTLLAVDDSATMRKVLEITFAGEDFRVVTADGSQSALTSLREEPAAAVIDTVLDGEDGYALAKEVRARMSHVAIVLLTSRFSPYDAARGRESGADDYLDKPFDTQALLDKTRKAMAARESAKAVAAPPRPAPMPAAPPTAQQIPAAPYRAGVVPRVNQPAIARPAYPTQRTHTLNFGGADINAPPVPVVEGGSVEVASAEASQRPGASEPLGGSPAQPSAPPPQAGGTSHPSNVRLSAVMQPTSSALDGETLASIGLTPQQTQAVLTLSREVVEKVVWEVVPQLAEALIREEIARLMKE